MVCLPGKLEILAIRKHFGSELLLFVSSSCLWLEICGNANVNIDVSCTRYIYTKCRNKFLQNEMDYHFCSFNNFVVFIFFDILLMINL